MQIRLPKCIITKIHFNDRNKNYHDRFYPCDSLFCIPDQ